MKIKFCILCILFALTSFTYAQDTTMSFNIVRIPEPNNDNYHANATIVKNETGQLTAIIYISYLNDNHSIISTQKIVLTLNDKKIFDYGELYNTADYAIQDSDGFGGGTTHGRAIWIGGNSSASLIILQGTCAYTFVFL